MLDLRHINRIFKRTGEKILKYRWLVILVFISLILFSFTGLSKIKTDVSTKKWFLEDDELTVTREKFEKIFGNNDFVAIHISSDDVFTTRNLKGIRDLGNDLLENVPYADEIISLTDFEFSKGNDSGMRIINLVPDKIPSEKEELEEIRKLALSKKNMAGKFISEDCRETWVMLRMKPYPENWQDDYKEDPALGVGRKVLKIVKKEKYSFLNPRATGMPVINIEKKMYFSKEMKNLMSLSLLVTILILLLVLRSFRGVIFPFITVIGSLIIAFGMQGWMGVELDPMVMTMPIYLGLAVAIGYSIHLFHYFNKEFKRNGSRRDSVLYAVEETGWPILFTALTTITALLSFLFVPVRPIRWVGLCAAGIVAVEYLFVIFIIPVLLSYGSDKKDVKLSEKRDRNRVEKFMERFGDRVLRHPVIIVVTLVISALICINGLRKFHVSFDIEETFGRSVPYVNRILSVGESKIGSIYSYSLGLEFPDPGDAKNPENLMKFAQLTEEVKALELTKKVTSLLDIIRDMNQTVNGGEEEFYRIPQQRNMIAQLLLLYENAGGTEAEKWVDYDYQRLHLMVEITKYNSSEINRELALLKKRCAELFPGSKLMLIGSVSQFSVMMDYVVFGQIKSFFIALIVIAVLLMIVFGSFRMGLIAMIPNIAPALVTGALMGYMGIPLDMMTVTIIPMLLGLAVDDTIHFINHAQLEFHRTGNYRTSVLRVFKLVGIALVMTSAVIILNFSVYITADANFFRNMGILVSFGIASALLTDFCVTPVLLRYFKLFGKEREMKEIKKNKDLGRRLA